jgi:hypothetical protein
LAVRRNSAEAVVSAEFAGTAAPLTVKPDPGSAWNAAPSDELLIQSCAQATRPRKIVGVSLTMVRSSNRAPSSLRVSVAVVAL